MRIKATKSFADFSVTKVPSRDLLSSLSPFSVRQTLPHELPQKSSRSATYGSFQGEIKEGTFALLPKSFDGFCEFQECLHGGGSFSISQQLIIDSAVGL